MVIPALPAQVGKSWWLDDHVSLLKLGVDCGAPIVPGRETQRLKISPRVMEIFVAFRKRDREKELGSLPISATDSGA